MDEWLDVKMQENPVEIGPWESKQIKIIYKQPKQNTAEIALLRIKAATEDGQSYEITEELKFKPLDVCKPCCEFNIEAQEQTTALCEGEEKTFKIKVSNVCKEKMSYTVKSAGKNTPITIEPTSFDLQPNQSSDVDLKIKQPKSSGSETNWKLDINALCGSSKSLTIITKNKSEEDCDPCYGFSASIPDPSKLELCEGEEGSVQILFVNNNKNKALDAQIKLTIKSEKLKQSKKL